MERKLVVKLDSDSRKILNGEKYQLNVFKGSISSKPIIGTFGKTFNAELGTENIIRWKDSYAGYTGPTEEDSGRTLMESVTALDMELGDKYVLSPEGDASIELRSCTWCFWGRFAPPKTPNLVSKRFTGERSE